MEVITLGHDCQEHAFLLSLFFFFFRMYVLGGRCAQRPGAHRLGQGVSVQKNPATFITFACSHMGNSASSPWKCDVSSPAFFSCPVEDRLRPKAWLPTAAVKSLLAGRKFYILTHKFSPEACLGSNRAENQRCCPPRPLISLLVLPIHCGAPTHLRPESFRAAKSSRSHGTNILG